VNATWRLTLHPFATSVRDNRTSRVRVAAITIDRACRSLLTRWLQPLAIRDTCRMRPVSPRTAAMEFGILGPLQVSRAGQPLELGSTKERVLLAILVIQVGEVVSIDRLTDALWGSRPPANPPRSIQVLVSRLRKALDADCIGTRGRGYALTVDANSVDLVHFERLHASGRELLVAGDARHAAATLREALALWRGEPLADLPSEHVIDDERRHLLELREAVLEVRIDADLLLGRHAALLPELERRARDHPFRERPIAQLMLAEYRCGRQAEALETYRLGRARLVETLGLEPGRELQQLEHEILQHAPSLGVPDRARPAMPRRKRRLLILGVTLAGLVAASAVAFDLTQDGRAVPVVLVPNSVAIIDPASNQIVADVPVGERPVGIAAGDGSLWVANAEDGTVSRIDDRTRTVKTIGIGATATDVTVTAHFVWIGNGSAGTLSRVDPHLGTVTATRNLRGSDNVFPNAEYGIASSKSMLFVASGGDVVLRLHGDTGRLDKRVPLRATPFAIAVYGGAAFAATASQIVRIDAQGAGINGPRVRLEAATAIATGTDSLWVGSHPGDAPSGVWRLDPNSLTPAFKTSVPDPVAIAVDPNGVWVASSADHRVYRIDPRSGTIIATIALRGAPAGIALSAGMVWVTIDAPA
jgi:YVTN family beta-propeller protein